MYLFHMGHVWFIPDIFIQFQEKFCGKQTDRQTNYSRQVVFEFMCRENEKERGRRDWEWRNGSSGSGRVGKCVELVQIFLKYEIQSFRVRVRKVLRK